MINGPAVLAAVRELWPQLPELVGADWPEVEPQLSAALAALDVADFPDPIALARLLLLFSKYPRAHERLAELVAPDEGQMRGALPSPLPPTRIGETPEGTGFASPRVGDLERRAEPPREERYVNTLVAQPGTDEPVASLDPAADYELLLDIGRHVEGSLLAAAGARWPDELLPGGGVWLRATLLLDGARDSGAIPFFLPPEGESFRCECDPDGDHGPACSPQRWVRFALHAPERPAVIEGELVVYYQAAAAVVVGLRFPVGQVDGTPSASLIGCLTSTFNDLGKLTGRTASVIVSPRPGRVLVNGASFVENPFAIGVGAADTSALNARTALFDSHFEARDGGLYSRYDTEFGKTGREYEQDLRRLAREGAELYVRLFSPPGSDNTVGLTLPALIRHEARLRGRPPIVQVLDDRFDEHAMLWSIVYDLPVGADSSLYQPCPAVQEFGPEGSRTGPIPAACPYDDAHRGRGDVLCPFGFWGLSCVVEQPPTVGRNLETAVFHDAHGVAVLAAVGGSLDEGLTDRHLRRLRAQLPGSGVHRPFTASSTDLAQALGPETMDIVYFYCHCGYDRRNPKAAVDRYLDLGEYTIQPLDINMWARTAWPDPHWPHRRPLVVLNGCHTAEVTSGTLNSFVPAFTQWAGASGLVGTEVTVEQGLAGWAMEELLARLLRGHSTGTALHGTRWAMLGRGNVMGLAYTSFCLANLALRPMTAGQE